MIQVVSLDSYDLLLCFAWAVRVMPPPQCLFVVVWMKNGENERAVISQGVEHRKGRAVLGLVCGGLRLVHEYC